MNHGCVTLDEVFAAAGVRAASLVPETSGYLALAIGDATSRLPFAIEERSVMLTTEGNVGITRRGEMLPPQQAARGLREVLSRLLAASQGTAMPALAHAGRTREESERGVDTVVEEIEAALIPVNRAAARRALARLARETIKAKEAGKVRLQPVKAPVAEVPPAPALAPALTPAPAPAAAAPRTPTPTPAPVVAAPRFQEPPPPPEADPTPTVLGMSEVEIDGPSPDPEDPEGQRDADGVIAAASSPHEEPVSAEPERDEDEDEDEITRSTAAVPNEAPMDELPTDLGEPAVLMQPSEEPEDAFELGRRPPRPLAEPITPPFALEAEPLPRELPATRAGAREAAPRAPHASWHGERAHVHTRADDLLARFGASCVDDAGMREAAACLRRIAGIDVTPPPARVELRVAPPAASRAYEALAQIPADAETPVLPRVRARRTWSLPSLGLTLIVLVAGLAGGGALVRLRPELFGTGTPAAAPPAAAPEPAAAHRDPTTEAPARAAEPWGALPPSLAERPGGARAERGTSERAR